MKYYQKQKLKQKIFAVIALVMMAGVFLCFYVKCDKTY